MSNQTNLYTETDQETYSGYAAVNGLNMYYEIHGKGTPLVLIHGGGSTIETTFGRVIHEFAKKRKVIGVELQAHGHTADINRAETFEQDADDVAALLKSLKIKNADFLGFSNGGNTAIQLAIRHSQLVRKLIIVSSFFKREGLYPQLWESLNSATLNDLPKQLQEAYKKVAPRPEDLSIMFDRDRNRMLEFKDWKAEDIQSIRTPALIILGEEDVVMPEHAMEMARLMPHARLAILPGGHGACIGEITTLLENSRLPLTTVAMMENFLNETMPVK